MNLEVEYVTPFEGDPLAGHYVLIKAVIPVPDGTSAEDVPGWVVDRIRGPLEDMIRRSAK